MLRKNTTTDCQRVQFVNVCFFFYLVLHAALLTCHSDFCSIATVHPTWDLLSSILYSLQGLAPSILVQGQGSTLPHIVSH